MTTGSIVVQTEVTGAALSHDLSALVGLYVTTA